MKRCLSVLLSSVIFLSVACPVSLAQDRKLVSGRITNKTDDNKPLTDVIVYAYSTIPEAEDAYKAYMQAKETGGWFNAGNVIEAIPDPSGYYEIYAVETGALMFDTMGLAPEPKVVPVNYRMEINVSFDVAIVIDESTVTADRGERPVVEPPEIYGNKASCGVANYPFKDRVGKSNARFVVQAYLLAANEKDTIEYRKPIVFDGEQYHLTQLRRMGYDPQNDPLYCIADSLEALTDSTTSISWKDTVWLDNPNELVYCKAKIWAEDYNKVIYEDSLKIFNTGRVRRPMRFLEYSFEEQELDPADYVKKARREKRDAAVSTKLEFVVGKAELDPKDTAGRASLEQLKTELHDAMYGEGSTLKEFHVTVTSSPDGPYAKNVDLSKKRMQFAQNEVIAGLDREKMRRVYMNPKAYVAPWTAVADLLEADSLMVEAAAVRAIVEKYPKSMDTQWGMIRRLPYYKKEISPRLPQLRSVNFKYVNEIFRQLTPEEIMERYQTDNDYRSGKKAFALYEYWHLFDLVKNERELQILYKRAMVDSKKAEGRLWPLPANNLAVSYIRSGVVDTTVLAPLIDDREPLNRVIRNKHNPKIIDEIINIEEVVANQVIMCLKGDHCMRAMELCTLLPDSKYGLLKAVTSCLAGYFRDNKSAEGKRVFELVRNSSPRNRVVMNLAVGNIGLAKAALAKLPQDDPVTLYLNAQVLCRSSSDYIAMQSANVDQNTYESDYDRAINYLKKCFEMDPEFIKIAETDWDIFEEIFKAAAGKNEPVNYGY